MSTNNAGDDLRTEMQKLGAREFEIVALAMDPLRGSAALAYAINRGADNPISYAIKIFDNPDWQPSGETRRRAVNVHARPTACQTCDGDRFVVVNMRKAGEKGVTGANFEEYAPCPDCNHQDAGFFRFDGTKASTPSPEKVREMMHDLRP